MRTITKTILLLGIILLACNGLWGCGGGGGGIDIILKVGEIQGPGSVDEYSFMDYGISAEGDTGIAYQWSVNPTTAGTFSNRTASATTFHPAGVTSDSKVHIQVTVTSDTADPVISAPKEITILEKVVMAPNVVEVDQFDMTLVSVSGNQFTFDYTGSSPQISVDDIIMGIEQDEQVIEGKQPYVTETYVPNYLNRGYLRRVKDFEDTGSQLIIVTDDAAIEEAVQEGRFSALLDFTGHTGEAYQSEFVQRTGAAVYPFPSMYVPLSGTVLYENGGLKIDIPTGFAEFSPEIELDMMYDLFQGFTYFKSAASGTLEFSIDVRASGYGHYEKHEEVSVYSYMYPFMFGAIPCAAVFDFKAGFDIDATLQGHLQAGFDSTTSVTLGAEYEYGVWKDISKRSQDFHDHPPSCQASGDVLLKGYIKPEIKILFFGLVGPGINVKPYLEFSGYAQLVPPCVSFELAAGITSDIFIRAEIFGITLAEYAVELLNIRIPFYNGDYPPGCFGLKVDPIDGVNQILENTFGYFFVTASGDSGITYQWSSDPPEYGYFDTPTLSQTNFHTYGVSSDKDIIIRVDVDSDNSSGMFKTKPVIIKDDDPCIDFDVGNIVGPNYMLDNEEPGYSVSAEGDTGITYFWSCDPSWAGYFNPNSSASTVFYPAIVSDPVNATIKVSVNSSHDCGPEYRSKPILIEHSDDYCDGFNIGSINGDAFIDEDTWEVYSVSPSGDAPYEYDWSCDPSNLGYFNDPSLQNPSFYAKVVPGNPDCTLKVVVTSAHLCQPDYKTTPITIKDDPSWDLVVSEISGPLNVDENTPGIFSVDASGDTNITYNWYCPQNAGQFGSPTSSQTSFTPDNVASDTPIQIKVDVNSDHCPQETRSKNVTIEDVEIPCPLQVGEIEGPEELDEGAYESFNIPVDGEDTGTTFQWSCIPPDAGDFDQPNSQTTGFTADDVDSSTPIQIRVVVDSDNCQPAAKTKGVTILDVPPMESGWARTWGGSGSDLSNGVAVDGNGNTYITGDFSGTVDFNPGPGVDEHTSNGSHDVFLSKFDSAGDFQWARTWGGGGGDYCWGVAIDGSGNAYITGVFWETGDFDPGPGVDEHTSNGGTDIFLSKFDSNGDFQWARTWGGSNIDKGFKVAIDGSGNAYITGYFWDTVDFDPGTGVDEHTSNGDEDIFLSKFDSNGDFQWARTWGGSYYDCGYGVAVDGSGNAYITGAFSSTVDFDSGPGVDWHTSHGYRDIFLSKFDSAGDFQWARTWGGSYYDCGCEVAVDGSGNSYVTGYFRGTADFDPDPGVDEHTSNDVFNDIFLSKFDSAGDFQWARTWGGSSTDWAFGVAVDGSGNAYITGYFDGTADFDPGPGVDWHTSNGERDIFLSKFYSAGDFQWARTWGGSSFDYGLGVAVDGSGNAYITGYFEGTADFDPGTGVDEHTSNGKYDTFLSKFPPDGNW